MYCNVLRTFEKIQKFLRNTLPYSLTVKMVSTNAHGITIKKINIVDIWFMSHLLGAYVVTGTNVVHGRLEMEAV